jgi:ubiquinone biosynthesis protein|tara:strand:- start:228 stop:1877 length:1650 start_codon:yes stop_codon:yes gene_type:complete
MNTKKLRDLKRFKTIVGILIKEGFGYYLTKITPKALQPKGETKLPLKPEERFRRTLEQLGPTFIKLGQILSLRPDLIPLKYVRELSNLQDDVPEFPYEDAKQTIEKELKKSLKELFKKFNKKPIAAASVSQVYKATLPNDDIVAVKVQRPGIQKQMKTDIEIMYALAKYAEKHYKNLQRYRPIGIIKEFEEWTLRELDFRKEAQNAKRFRKNAKHVKTLVIPKVYNTFSSERILTLEFIDGVELHQLHKLKNKKSYNLKKIVKNGFEMTLKQVFEDGFFHGDPHPGNILVLPGNKIALVDFGIVGYFNKQLKKKSIELFYGVINDDMDYICDVFLAMGLMDGKNTNKELFKGDVKKVIEPIQQQTLKEAKISLILEEVLDIALHHNIRMPVDFVLFGKTVLTIEGVGLQFVPDFKLVETARPYAERLIKKDFNMQNMAKNVKKDMYAYKRFFSSLPDKINSTFQKIQQGKIKVDIDDTDVKRLGSDIYTSSNRMTFSIIIASLLITGGIVKDIGTIVWGGFPIASLISFLLALLVSLALLRSILKEGNN